MQTQTTKKQRRAAPRPPSRDPELDRIVRRMHRAIERMIDALDAIEADVDLEPDADLEDSHDQEASNLAGDEKDDREEDRSDREYSLGASTGDGNQENWAQGDGHDGEEVNEDGGDILDVAHDGLRDFPDPDDRRLVAPQCGKPIVSPEFMRGEVPFDGDLHPQALAYRVTGDCLVPVVRDGDVIIVEPVLPKRGEMACVWPAGAGPLVKYVETSLDHMFPHNPKNNIVLEVRLRMLNPPMTIAIFADKIDRIWRVSQVVPAAKAIFRAPTISGYQPEPRHV